MTPLQHARAALADLHERYDWLEDSVLPGTARPYRAPTLTAEQRLDRDHLARQERHERASIAPGDSPDPYHFDAVDLRDLILTTADAIAERVAQVAGVDRMPDASWGSAAGPYLEHANLWLEQAAEVDPTLPAMVGRKAGQLVMRADMLLGNITDGQTLDAPCFVCDSRTDRHPTGGGRTLRFRQKHHEHTPTGTCNTGCRDYVVCESGRCEPTTDQCGYRFRGQPAWDLATEAKWLADRLGATPEQPPCERCKQPVTRVSSGPTPHRYCTPECHRAARAETRRAERQAAA